LFVINSYWILSSTLLFSFLFFFLLKLELKILGALAGHNGQQNRPVMLVFVFAYVGELEPNDNMHVHHELLN
jgi:hypothetical protein